jgi:hypothetical protein
VKKFYKIFFRGVLGICIGVFSGYIVTQIILDEMSSRELDAIEKKNILIISSLLFVVFELFFLLSKIHLKRKRKSIINHYTSFIKLFNNKYMPTSEKERFVVVLSSLENKRAEFNEIRILMEHILLRFGKKDLNLLPPSVFDHRSSPLLSECLSTMKKDRANFPDHINYSFRFIKDTCSAFSHSNPARPGDYLNEACVFALMECLFFLKTSVDSKTF